MLRAGRRPRKSDAGFTLTELLLVIVILAILAAVVVFSVRGTRDRGMAAACTSDVAEVTQAAEAFYAQNGRYASGVSELVSSGFLHGLPSTANYQVYYSINTAPGTRQGVVVYSPSCVSDLSGADADTAYCAELLSARDRYRAQGLGFEALNVDQFQLTVNLVNEVALTAPAGMKNDWAMLASAVKAMQQAVTDTGLSRADIQTLYSGHLPPGFSQAQSDALNSSLQAAMSGSAFQTGGSEIVTQAGQVCGFALP